MNAAGAAAADPSLLPGAARPSPWLTLAILVLSFIAGLELVAATAAMRAAVDWSPRLAGSVTLAVSGDGLESTDAAAARATEILARAPGVARIAVLDPDASDGLVGRLMGLTRTAGGTDRPRLIATTFYAGDRGLAVAIIQDLRRENVVAAVDDHGVWTGPIERTALAAAAVAAGSLMVLIALVWVFVATSVASAIRKRASRTTLLLHLGATDEMILRPFRARALGGAALGGLIGVAAAVALAAAVNGSPTLVDWIRSRSGAPIGEGPGLDLWDLAAATIWLPVVVLIAAWAAGGAVRSRLRALA